MPIPTVYFPASNRHYNLYPGPNGMNDSMVADIGQAPGGRMLSEEINGTFNLVYLQPESSYPDRTVPEQRG